MKNEEEIELYPDGKSKEEILKEIKCLLEQSDKEYERFENMEDMGETEGTEEIENLVVELFSKAGKLAEKYGIDKKEIYWYDC